MSIATTDGSERLFFSCSLNSGLLTASLTKRRKNALCSGLFWIISRASWMNGDANLRTSGILTSIQSTSASRFCCNCAFMVSSARQICVNRIWPSWFSSTVILVFCTPYRRLSQWRNARRMCTRFFFWEVGSSSALLRLSQTRHSPPTVSDPHYFIILSLKINK